MNLLVKMKSGENIILDNVGASLSQVVSKLNKVKFLLFGPIILNVNEIESITEK